MSVYLANADVIAAQSTQPFCEVLGASYCARWQTLQAEV